MARLQALCPNCGMVTLDPAEVDLVVAPGEGAPFGSGSRWGFTCPGCYARISRAANERVAARLLKAGVTLSVHPSASVPDQPAGSRTHPERPPSGPPLTTDDLLDLHVLLRRDDWFERLLAADRSA